MLRKLMKHELRATGRVMLPLFLVVLVTAVGANLSTRMLLEMENDFLNVLGMALLTAFVLVIVGVCIVAFVMMIQRFYKNLLQDEGYVMMTLPVRVHEHVWSKLLVSMIWYAATAVAVMAAFLILVFNIQFIDEFLQEVGLILEALRLSAETIHVVLFGLELLALLFFLCAGACLQFYAAMAIGHSFASHKLLLSVAVYFGGQFVLQLLGGGLFWMVNTTQLDYYLAQALPTLSGVAGLHVLMAVLIVGAILFTAPFYAITVWFLKNRLNLE